MTLICGLPNAGKTTYSERFGKVLHLDDFPRSKFLNCNKAVAEAEGDITVEGIYNLRVRRKLLIEAMGERTPKVCIWLDTPIEECISRENRGRPKGIITSPIEPPTFDEGWDEIIIVRNNESISYKRET